MHACVLLCHLGKVGRLPDSINSTEGDDIRMTFVPGLHHVSQYVHPPFGAEDLDQTLLYTGPHQTLDTCRREGGGGTEVFSITPGHTPHQ